MSSWLDLKYAWRLLRKSWGYTLLCASVVALSVGLALWTWSSVAYPQLLKPLGLPNSENWYSVQLAADGAARPRPGSVDAYTYQELLKQNRSIDYVGAFVNGAAVLSEGQASTSLRTATISPRLLSQVVPLMGRTFQPADAQPGAPAVAILSYDTWHNYFAADAGIIGKTTRIDAAPVQIVGVMPKEVFVLMDFELWMPLRLPVLARPGDSKLRLNPLVALGPKQNLDAVRNEMKTAVAAVNANYPDLFNIKRHPVLIPANRMYFHEATPVVAVLILMSVAVFLLGGLNISLVFLARLLERSRELALRTALGASRSRLMRQCLRETAAFVLIGLAAGYVLAMMGIRWTEGWGEYLNRILAFGRINGLPVLRNVDIVVAVAAAVAIWLLSTLIPAWRIAKQDPAVVLAGSGKGVSVRGRGKGAGILVGLQVVISSLVLVVCGSMVMALNKETSKPTRLQSASIMMPTSATVFDERYAEPARRLRYWEDLTAAVAAKIPGADIAYASDQPSTPGRVTAAIESRQGGDRKGTLTLPFTAVSENYFDMLGVRLRDGRLFNSNDTSGSLNVAIVDEELASRYWPNENVIGKRVQLNPTDNGTWLTIVGVVSSVTGGRPYNKEDIGALYRPLLQAVPSEFHMLAKLPAITANTRVTLRAAAFAVDRDLPLRNLQTLDNYLEAMRFNLKSLMPIVMVIALITALVTASGLFGLISRSVAQRTQEVGIRRALGATSWRATSMFQRQGALYLSVAIIGVALGTMLMAPISRLYTNILDYVLPATLGVVLLMGLVIFAATYLPSRRAVALEPGDALRYE
ncbi:MAG TPA: ABC transporter permease [Thermoanaerobaculia bacterium]|jgi:predicted permease